MKLLLASFIIIILGCQPAKEKSVFDQLKGQTDIIISLKDYQLDSIPPTINTLKGVKRLAILKDSAVGWVAYPPLSALGEQPEMDTSHRRLPKEITELESLETLSLFNLDLVSLPEELYKLKSLDTLILALNKLRISQEVDKLKKLTRLKYLDLGGNMMSKDDIARLKGAMPGTTIFPDSSFYSNFREE